MSASRSAARRWGASARASPSWSERAPARIALGTTRGWRRFRPAWFGRLRGRSGTEKRPPPGAVRLGSMDVKLQDCFLSVDDHDKAIAFYRDALGFEVRNDVSAYGMRW